MSRSAGDRGPQRPQSRGSRSRNAMEQQAGRHDRSQLDAGRRASRDESVHQSRRPKLGSRRTSDVEKGHVSSRHSVRPRKDSSANERRHLEARTPEAVRRDREEQKLKAGKDTSRSVSHSKRERELLQPGDVPLNHVPT